MARRTRNSKVDGTDSQVGTEVGDNRSGIVPAESGTGREEETLLSQGEIETQAEPELDQPFTVPGANFTGEPVKRKKRVVKKAAKNTDNSEPLGEQVCDALEMLSAFMVPNGVAMTTTERRMITKAANGIESEVAQRVMKFAGPVAGFGALLGYGIRVATMRANVVQAASQPAPVQRSNVQQAQTAQTQTPIWQQPKHESESKSAILGSPIEPSPDVAAF